MTTVPEKGVLKGFRGFNMNRRSDVLPPQSSKDFTLAIEALKDRILEGNEQVEALLETLLNHIVNFNNPHLLNFAVLYPKLREEIYNRYILYFDSNKGDVPLSKDDFLEAISTNPLMLFELIRLITTNVNEKESNVSNNIDISSHGQTSVVSEPLYSYSRVVSGSNDYPYYNDIAFINTTDALPAGYEDYIKGLLPAVGQITPISTTTENDILIRDVIIDYANKTTLEGSRNVANVIKNIDRNGAIATFSALEEWGKEYSNVFSDAGVRDNGYFNEETIFLSFRVADTDLPYIGESNPFPYWIHMFSTGEGFLITVDYENNQKEIIVRQFINVKGNIYVIDDEALVIPVQDYSLAIRMNDSKIEFISFVNTDPVIHLQSFERERQFKTLYDPIDVDRFILTNIRLKRDDTYMYDYVSTSTNSGFTDIDQKQNVFVNYLEVHKGHLPDDYIEDKLSSTL